MRILRRFWITLEKLPRPSALNLGCGVTAYDLDDALALVTERIFRGQEIPRLVDCVEDVDVSKLDPKHVAPNIGVVTRRGIWFPQGYDN
jgi:hypothetical protein